MNERIRELAEQAGAIRCHGYIPHPLDGHLIWTADAALDTTKMDAKKFAVLIVKECRDIVGKTRDQAIEDEWNVDEAMSTAMFDIEDHFGV